MNNVTAKNETELNVELLESRERLDALAGELRAVDAKLEELQVERQQFELVQDACGALEKLAERDAAELFWRELVSVDTAQEHVSAVRTRVDAFQSRVAEIEGDRTALLQRIEREEWTGELLEDDLDELKRIEEEKKLEWLVEREADELPLRSTVMPWASHREDDERLRRALGIAVLLSLFLGVVLPWIPLPVLDRWEVIEVPDRFTRLIREEREVPPPVVQELLRPEEPKPVEEEPLLAEEGTPEPVATPDEPKPGAGSKGILAFREQFSSLAESAAPSRLGSDARITRSGELASGRPSRSLVTTQGPGSSGGIDISSLSREVGGGGGDGIEGVQVTQVTSSIGAIGGGVDRPLSGGPGSSRTDEEIQIVFDRHKSALYRLYNRALRRDPTLQGQMVLRITIEPDGSVSLCELKSSDMKAPNLASRVVERVETFDFGAKDGIPAITILYPIDFLPAT